jgi:hypothetical protein
MKLTNQQITKIDETLVLNGLIYDDIKLEVTDHIASEIENKLQNNQSNFKEVFDEVFDKWERLLTPTSNAGWLGIFILAPKAVVDKMVSYSKKQTVYILISTFIFGALIATFISLTQKENISSALNLVLTSLFFLICLFTIVCVFLIRKSKHKTTYGRLFLVRSWLAFLFFYQFNIGRKNSFLLEINYFWKDNFLMYFVYGFGFFYCFYQVTMALEHFKTVKKYKLSIS